MHKNSLLLAMASALLVLVVGCAGSAYVRGSASVTAPDLVYVSPGVQVIADYNEPIFYSDNFYWRYEGNVWYRSSDYTGGWVRFNVVPVGITNIERPAAYIHYHGEVRANANPVVRDHRDAAPPQQAAPAQVHDERNEQKAEQKEERKDQKAEQKEERKEQKAEQHAEHKEDHKDEHKGHH